MKTTIKNLHVSQLPTPLRHGRADGFVNVTVEDAPEPSEDDRLAALREEIARGDQAVTEGRVSPATIVFERLRRSLKDKQSR